MSDKGMKDLRKQLRNVVQEILPGVLTQEMVQQIYGDLVKHINQRMDFIASNAKQTLDQIDQRSKDVQSYVIRQNTKE